MGWTWCARSCWSKSVYRTQAGLPALLPFERDPPGDAGAHHLPLRQALRDAAPLAGGIRRRQPGAMELDFFFSRLFGEVLSQPGFGFHANYDAGQVCANLIESAQKFRWAVEDRTPAPADPSKKKRRWARNTSRWSRMACWPPSTSSPGRSPPDDAVLIAPAYTFLLTNRPVEHQFWLDVGSSAWSERLYQPLTHPYILSRDWTPDRVWTDVDEYEHNRDALYRLVIGPGAPLPAAHLPGVVRAERERLRSARHAAARNPACDAAVAGVRRMNER